MRLRSLISPCAALALCCLLGAGSAGAAEDDKKGAAHKTTQSESYVPIEPMYASIIDGTRSRGLLMVEIGLDIPDAKLRDRVTPNLPALRDAYVQSLLIYAATAVRPTRQPNVEDIANRLQTITNRVVGREGAKVLMAQTAIRIVR